MPKTLSKALFTKFLRSKAFRQQMQDFHILSGMECLLLDNMGNEKLRYPRKIVSAWGLMNLQNPQMKKRMVRTRQLQLSGQQLPQNPWIELIQPLKIDKEIIGYWVLSACREQQASEKLSKNFWSEIAREGLDLTWTQWHTAWLELPPFHQEQQQAWERVLELQSQKALHHLEEVSGQLPRQDALPPLILRACEQVQARYRDPLYLKDLAETCQVSPEHLSRVFHESTGLRFSEYLAETRVNAACEALTSGTDPIAEIAGRSGFSTLSRFNQCFKTHTGMTPSAWRKRKKKY